MSDIEQSYLVYFQIKSDTRHDDELKAMDALCQIMSDKFMPGAVLTPEAKKRVAKYFYDRFAKE